MPEESRRPGRRGRGSAEACPLPRGSARHLGPAPACSVCQELPGSVPTPTPTATRQTCAIAVTRLNERALCDDHTARRSCRFVRTKAKASGNLIKAGN